MLSSRRNWVSMGLLLLIPILNFVARSLTWEQGPIACDSFGYWFSALHPLNPALSHPDTDELIEYFRSQSRSISEWSEVIGPQAFHYEPKSQKLIIPYLPLAPGSCSGLSVEFGLVRPFPLLFVSSRAFCWRVFSRGELTAVTSHWKLSRSFGSPLHSRLFFLVTAIGASR
jgi:hypothetical protein